MMHQVSQRHSLTHSAVVLLFVSIVSVICVHCVVALLRVLRLTSVLVLSLWVF